MKKSTPKKDYVKEYAIGQIHMILDNEGAFYKEIQKAMKESGVLATNKKTLPVEIKQKLIARGYNMYVKKWLNTAERKKITTAVLNTQAKKLYVFKREAHF